MPSHQQLTLTLLECKRVMRLSGKLPQPVQRRADTGASHCWVDLLRLRWSFAKLAGANLTAVLPRGASCRCEGWCCFRFRVTLQSSRHAMLPGACTSLSVSRWLAQRFVCA